MQATGHYLLKILSVSPMLRCAEIASGCLARFSVEDSLDCETVRSLSTAVVGGKRPIWLVKIQYADVP